jgi:hypothetical protein
MSDVRSETVLPPSLAGRIAEYRSPPARIPKGFWGRLGPGLITGASDDDPSGIATYSQAGAQFGYALCWACCWSPTSSTSVPISVPWQLP